MVKSSTSPMASVTPRSSKRPPAPERARIRGVSGPPATWTKTPVAGERSGVRTTPVMGVPSYRRRVTPSTRWPSASSTVCSSLALG